MPVLEWDKRMKIAVGAARGLAYLHEDCMHPNSSISIVQCHFKNDNLRLNLMQAFRRLFTEI